MDDVDGEAVGSAGPSDSDLLTCMDGEGDMVGSGPFDTNIVMMVVMAIRWRVERNKGIFPNTGNIVWRARLHFVFVHTF